MKTTTNKTRKSKNEIIRGVLGTYLQKRNYMISDRYRKSELVLSQSTEQMIMNTTIKNEISRSNSFLFSNIFCLNNHPAQVDQHFTKLITFIKSQPETVRKELCRIVNPLLCHLYIEMLKGRDWRLAIEFLKKHATLVGYVDTSQINNISILGQKINGTVDEQSPVVATSHTAITFLSDNSSSSSDNLFKDLIHCLSQITRIQDIENYDSVAEFRSCKYEIHLSSSALNKFKNYLAKSAHSLIIQIFQTWFHIETLDDKNFDDFHPSSENYDFAEHDENENKNHLLLNGFSTNFLRHKMEEPTTPISNSFSHHNFVDMDDDDEITEVKNEVKEDISVDRLQRLKECSEKLTYSNHPICFYGLENSEGRVSACAFDPMSCHIATGCENSSISLWSMKKNTQYSRKPYSNLLNSQCQWHVENCDNNFSDEDTDTDDEVKKEINKTNHLLPIYARMASKKKRWKEFMSNRCSENTFTDTGGITLRGHNNAVTDVLFSAHNPLLFSVSRDLTMRAWKASDYNCCAVYRGHNHPIWCVAESPNGMNIATGSRDTTVRLWSTDREFPLRIYAGHSQDIDSVAFHPNGSYLATGSADLSVRLWEVSSGKWLRVFNGCKLPVRKVNFSPNGKYLAAAGEESRIRIFDLQSGSQLAELKDHTSSITDICWSPNSEKIASSCSDGTIRVWNISLLDAPVIVTPDSNHTATSNGTTDSHPKTNSSSQQIMAYSTYCRNIYKLEYNSLNGTLSCIGHS